MSFGASSFPEDGHDAAALIAVADANLYESKRWGGDTVTVRPEPISGEAVDSRAFSTLDSLVSAVDNKDHYTRRHSAQVAEYTAAIGKALGFSKEQHGAPARGLPAPRRGQDRRARPHPAQAGHAHHQGSWSTCGSTRLSAA